VYQKSVNIRPRVSQGGQYVGVGLLGVTACGLVGKQQRFGRSYCSTKDGGSTFPRIVGMHIQIHTARDINKQNLSIV
jgi:hypothetical protein